MPYPIDNSLIGNHLLIQDHKCFPKYNWQGYQDIRPINVLLGKNNSGKSAMLDAVRRMHELRDKIAIGFRLPYEFANRDDRRLDYSVSDSKVDSQPVRIMAKDAIDKVIWYTPEIRYPKEPHSDELANSDALRRKFWSLGTHFFRDLHEFRDKLIVRQVAAERDIKPELSINNNDSLTLLPDGSYFSNLLRKLVNHTRANKRDLVERIFLSEANKILGPEVTFDRILTTFQLSTDIKELWEVVLEHSYERVPLVDSGSGIKTVFLVLANTILLNDGQAPHAMVFEELENNLHPSTLRKLMQYIRDYAVSKNIPVFIATHSHIVIDMFASDEQAAIYHVTHNGTSGTIKRVDTILDRYHIFDDLGVRASDLLQSNCILWVEGPSDMVYIEKWLDLWTDGQIRRGAHYQFALYGGSIGSEITFDTDGNPKALIQALKLNRNAVFIADSDNDEESDDFKPHVKRVIEEKDLSEIHCWITQGREIENYIPNGVWKAAFPKLSVDVSPFMDIPAQLQSDCKLKHEPKKMDLAKRVLPVLTKEDLAGSLDLAEQLNSVAAKIRQFNQIG